MRETQRQIKFRAWDGDNMQPWEAVKSWHFNWLEAVTHIFMQYTGLLDKNNKEYYIGDIGRFDNGDTFHLSLEEWLEVVIVWIGDPECEDQARDLYRIENAKIIGNIYESPELLK